MALHEMGQHSAPLQEIEQRRRVSPSMNGWSRGGDAIDNDGQPTTATKVRITTG